MVTTIRVDDCADHMNKRPDLIIKNTSEKTITKILPGRVQMTIETAPGPTRPEHTFGPQ